MPHEAVSVHFASRDDIRRAINALSVEEMLGLRRYAQRLAWRFTRDRFGDWEVIFQDAIVAALDTRRWDPTVPFVSFLRWVILSVARNACSKSRRRGVEVEVEDWMRSGDERNRQVEGAREVAEQIIASCSADPQALQVIKCLSEEINGPETQELLGISDKNYATIVRRIKRRAERIVAER